MKDYKEYLNHIRDRTTICSGYDSYKQLDYVYGTLDSIDFYAMIDLDNNVYCIALVDNSTTIPTIIDLVLTNLPETFRRCDGLGRYIINQISIIYHEILIPSSVIDNNYLMLKDLYMESDGTIVFLENTVNFGVAPILKFDISEKIIRYTGIQCDNDWYFHNDKRRLTGWVKIDDIVKVCSNIVNLAEYNFLFANAKTITAFESVIGWLSMAQVKFMNKMYYGLFTDDQILVSIMIIAGIDNKATVLHAETINEYKNMGCSRCLLMAALSDFKVINSSLTNSRETQLMWETLLTGVHQPFRVTLTDVKTKKNVRNRTEFNRLDDKCHITIYKLPSFHPNPLSKSNLFKRQSRFGRDYYQSIYGWFGEREYNP